MMTSNSPDISSEQLPEGLRILAEMALSNARRELEQTGRLNPAYCLRHPDGEIETVQLSDDMAELFFGTSLRRKVFFDVLRLEVETAGITAVILVTDMHMGKATEKLLALPRDEVRRILDGADISDLERQGWATKCESILVSVQTEEKAALVTQEYERDRPARRITWGSRITKCFPQSALEGRMKLFGKRDDDAEVSE